MQKQHLPYFQTGFFSKTVVDYLNSAQELKQFISQFPSLEALHAQAVLKTHNYTLAHRTVLHQSMVKQHQKIKLSTLQQQNIDALALKNTVTVTTGHQLCLFGGPLYFVLKIASVVNLCKQLNAMYSDFNFVPLFWMASEDHDFEEINHFVINNNQYSVDKPYNGAVGQMFLDTQSVYKQLESHISTAPFGAAVLDIFKKVYKKGLTLSDTTQILVYELFGHEGLLAIEPNDRTLKRLFNKGIEDDVMLQRNLGFMESDAISLEKMGYKRQISGRAVNYFLLGSNERSRIDASDDDFVLASSGERISREKMQQLIDESIERFSPNVVMRPLYQETILPNIAYVGGGAEVAYWMQLKSIFAQNGTMFPILILRNSVHFIDSNQAIVLKKLGITTQDIFKPIDELLQQYVFNGLEEDQVLKDHISAVHIALTKLKEGFLALDGGMEKYILSEIARVEKRLNHIKHKAYKTEKRKHQTAIDNIEALKKSIFPNGSLKERTHSFFEYYALYGPQLLPQLIQDCNPLNPQFIVYTTD